MRPVCCSDFAVQQRHVTLHAADAVVPAWHIHPGLQSLPLGGEL